MFRYFTFSKNKKYIDVLASLVKNYNNSYHRIIKTNPSSVNKSNEAQVYKTLYGDEEYLVDFFFKKGDYVREVIDKTIFVKGYTPNWSKEIYVINELILSNPPTYRIKGLDGKEFEWRYYKQELQKVNPVEFPYGTYQIIEETLDKYKVKKLNSENQDKEFWITKDEFNSQSRSKLS